MQQKTPCWKVVLKLTNKKHIGMWTYLPCLRFNAILMTLSHQLLPVSRLSRWISTNLSRKSIVCRSKPTNCYLSYFGGIAKPSCCSLFQRLGVHQGPKGVFLILTLALQALPTVTHEKCGSSLMVLSHAPNLVNSKSCLIRAPSSNSQFITNQLK